MVWAVTIGTFLAVVVVVVSLFYAFASGEPAMVRRLSRLADADADNAKGAFAQKQSDRAQGALVSIGQLVPGGTSSRAQLMMTRAGFRNPNAVLALRGVRVLLPVALVGAVYFTGIYAYYPALILVGAFLAGLLLPEIWLLWTINARRERLRRALPDALDLLVICVEAGLGLDQALMLVSQELKVVHGDLSDELQLVNLEMRVGKSRLEALRELARRTGIEDLKALVAMLVQTERFGTSIASSLRVHSDDLRTRRRQRAEEMGAKTTIKMVPILVLFIFPALMVVILLPAIITIIRQFAKLGLG
ncbi:MAG TPA: type II secretion system F family protein [Candidatus Acidoferrales bacterium]|nr:type II secretion system F family protein [Candidatus Acidoferrales bacterium]